MASVSMFLPLVERIVAANDAYLLDHGPEEQIATAVKRLEYFALTTPLTPVTNTFIDLAGFGEADVYFASADEPYLLLSEVAEQIGMTAWGVCEWARRDHLHAIEDQRQVDEDRGDGMLGYGCLRSLVDMGLSFIRDDPEAKPDAGGKRWSFAGDWLIAHDRIPALMCASPWSREFLDNVGPHMGMSLRKVWGDGLKGVPTYGADGQPTGGNAFDDLFSGDGLTEEEALRRARRGPSGLLGDE